MQKESASIGLTEKIGKHNPPQNRLEWDFKLLLRQPMQREAFFWP